jgi:hypothetical protein
LGISAAFVPETTLGCALWRCRSQVGHENSASGSIPRNKWMILRVSSLPFFRKRLNLARKPITAAGESARDALCAIRKFVARTARRQLKGQHIQERLSLSVPGSL